MIGGCCRCAAGFVVEGGCWGFWSAMREWVDGWMAVVKGLGSERLMCGCGDGCMWGDTINLHRLLGVFLFFLFECPVDVER